MRPRLPLLIAALALAWPPAQVAGVAGLASPRQQPGARPSSIATGVVRGVVVDARTGDALTGVHIAAGPSCDALTDAQGTFSCPTTTPGTHVVRVSMLGYVRPDIEVSLTAGQTIDLRIELTETPAPLHETVTVTPDRFATRDPATPGEMTITSSDLFALRGVLADDPLRAVQAMPGVSSNDDFNADIVIRGVSPHRTSLLIDGTRTRTAVHALQGQDDSGSVSLVNSDLLDRVTVSPGARPLRSGGRSSGEVEFSTRDGSRSSARVRGIAGAAIASLVAEGPLGPSGGSAGWMLAGRASYVGWIARRIEPATTTTFVFGDVNAKLTWDAHPRHRLSLLALAGRLAIDERDDAPGRNSLDHALTDSGMALASSRWQATPALTIRHRVAVGADRFHNENAAGEELGRGRKLDVAAYHDTAWMPGARLAVEGGVMAERATDALHLRRLSTRPPFVTVLETTSSTRDTLGGHLGVTWTPHALVTVMSGARLDDDSLVRGGPAVSGWALSEWRLSDAWTVRGGVTLMHQSPAAEQLVGTRGHPSLPADRAATADVLVSHRLGSAWRLQVAAYRRDGRDEARLPNAEPQVIGGLVRPASATSRWDARLDSRASGAEILVQRMAPTRLSGWLAYAYGRMRVHDRVTGERFAGDFDQRHGLNAYAAWRLSYRTAAVAKFRYGSNVPFQGYYAATAAAPDGTPQYVVAGTRNTARLPVYARLDLRVHRAFTYNARRLTLFGEVLNVLNRTNWGPTGGRSAERLFPVVPTAGLLVEW